MRLTFELLAVLYVPLTLTVSRFVGFNRLDG